MGLGFGLGLELGLIRVRIGTGDVKSTLKWLTFFVAHHLVWYTTQADMHQ